MGIQNILDLTGIDIVAGGDDHPLGPAAEIDEALVIHGAQVAGIHPGEAVVVPAQGLGGLLGMVHILLHHCGAGQQNFALCAVGHLLIGTGLDDLDIGVREGQANGALLIHIHRRQAAGGDSLGGTVTLPHLHNGVVVIKELIKLLLQLNGQAITAGENALEAGEVGIIHAGQAQQRLIQGGDTGNEIALILHDLLGIALGGEPGNENAPAAAGQHRVDAHAQAKAMEQRHSRQHPVSGAEHGVGGDDLLG